MYLCSLWHQLKQTPKPLQTGGKPWYFPGLPRTDQSNPTTPLPPACCVCPNGASLQSSSNKRSKGAGGPGSRFAGTACPSSLGTGFGPREHRARSKRGGKTALLPGEQHPARVRAAPGPGRTRRVPRPRRGAVTALTPPCRVPRGSPHGPRGDTRKGR